MSSTAAPAATGLSPAERLEVLFEELAELAGQRNAIDGRIVQIVAELDRDELCGATGARSVAALVAWKLGLSSTNAHTITTVARRLEEFPRCAAGMAEAGCRWIRSGSSPRGPLRALTSTMRSWRRWPRSTSCAPRCGSNRDPNPSLGPNRSAQSAKPPATRAAAGASDFPTTRRPRSTPPWPLTSMR
ncbi:hypothetical protein I552_4570 [Mycobacterium xenopi 3993]|nr:hypothetical protein I552_4570 [Mycobacterium xenopi 3993]